MLGSIAGIQIQATDATANEVAPYCAVISHRESSLRRRGKQHKAGTLVKLVKYAKLKECQAFDVVQNKRCLMPPKVHSDILQDVPCRAFAHGAYRARHRSKKLFESAISLAHMEDPLKPARRLLKCHLPGAIVLPHDEPEVA